MTRTSRREFLQACGGAAVALTLPRWSRTEETANPARRPNVIVMIADDLGSGDVSCLFRKTVPTPNLDRLARSGVTFAQGYVTMSLCAPSRAGYFTGRYPQRFGFEDNGDTIPANLSLLPGAFRAAGYATGLIGKWHSGGPKPHERGCFDETLCYYGPFLNYHKPVLERNGKAETFGEYSTDLFAREAEAFIDRYRDRPFQLTLAFNAPHIIRVLKPAGQIAVDYDRALASGEKLDVPKVPMARPGEAAAYEAQFPGDKARADTAATIVALDQAVGRVLDKLAKTSLDKSTIVFFFSDNGGHPENRSENLPLRDYKWSMHEGGLRVPFFAAGPGVFPAGVVYQEPVSTMDILPTCAAAAGVKLPEGVEGVNLAPFLKEGATGVPHESLFFRMKEASAIRRGKWKLVGPSQATPALYDIPADPAEARNLAAAHPDVVADLQQRWKDWNATLPASGTNGRRKGKAGAE